MRSWTALALTLCLAGSAEARDVRVPIRLDYGFLRELLLASAFRDPEQTAAVYSDGVGCSHVTLSHPELHGGEGAATVLSDVDTQFGTLFVGICLFAVHWNGRIESHLEPVLDRPAALVHFRVRDSRLLEADGSERGSTATVWDWVERYVRPRLEQLTIDLSAPMADLRATLPLFLSDGNAARAQTLVDSLQLESVTVTPEAVTLGVRLEAPSAPPPPVPTGAEPELTPEEVARFEAALSRWDGFITYVVKNAGAQTADPALREELLEVLLDAREDLVDSLGRPAREETDPVRPLFLASWRRLGQVLRELGPKLGSRGVLRYLGFIAAGDALAALDELGPEFGFELTSDGLRRLARVIAPGDTRDPLDAPDAVDPELRRALDFGEPLAPPAGLDETAPPEPEPAPENATDPDRSWLDSALRRFAALLFSEARAAQPPSAPPRLSPEEQRRLRGWAPARSELNEYLPLVQRLLRSAAEDALTPRKVEPTVRRGYLDLQLATAWQETCWRHYVKVRGQVRAIRSSAGAVGIMQVNSRVWRGFYDPRFLLADPAYNARAGSEILLRYYLDVAYAQGEQKRPGGIDDLVRATYSAYNGGPGALARYRNPKVNRLLRAIDAGFFKKYQAVRGGRELEVLRCFG